MKETIDTETAYYPMQEFFIPVWSQVRLTASELKLVNHPAFARLSNIYQLGQTHLVFRGATHRRWEHAIGTVHAAQLMATALERNYREAQLKRLPSVTGSWKRGPGLRSHELAFVRMAALLHDVGHLPAGHTFEDELGLLNRHDTDERLSYVLDRREWPGLGPARTLREIIDSEYDLAAKAADLDMPASEIFLELVSKTRADRVPSSKTFRTRVCRDIVGNTICADLLDYLHRDWHHLGKVRPFDNRLLDYVEIREHVDRTDDSRLVVNLRGGAEVRLDAVTAIFELLESRYQLGEVALFHRTKLSASAMLERLVAEIADGAEKLGGQLDGGGWFAGQIDRLMEVTDEGMLDLLVELGQEIAKQLKPETRTRLREALKLAGSLRYRQLHKQAIAFRAFELPTSLTFVRTSLGGAEGAANRLSVCRALEEDFKLPAGSVVIYCPARAPHAKIAEVQVLIHERVDGLAALERDSSDPAMTSGLLDAQMKRFDRLWRVQISVSPAAKDQLRKQKTLSDFERTVECLVLKANHGTSRPEDVAEEIAAKLVANAEFNDEGRVLISAHEIHARTRSVQFYPTGAPTLASLLIDSECSDSRP